MIDSLMNSTAPVPAVEMKDHVPADHAAKATVQGAGHDVKLPSKVVTARFGVSRRTLDRWMRDVTLGFPRPLVINNRLYFSLSEIEAWETECAKRHAAKPG